MRRSIVTAILAAVMLGCQSSANQSDERAASRETPPPLRFPDSWVGTWRGDMTYWSRRGRQTVPLTLEIGPHDEESGDRRWELTYGTQPPRRYRLRTIDAASGRYAVDEQNGIVLPARLVDDTLLSRFEVGRQLLLTRQRFLRDRIEHEIVVGPTQTKATGRNVDTYDVPVLQRAVLRRVPTERHGR